MLLLLLISDLGADPDSGAAAKLIVALASDCSGRV